MSRQRVAFQGEYGCFDGGCYERDVWLVNTNGTGLRRFADDAIAPAWSADSRKLAYLGEFAAPLFGARRVARYLAAWRDAQGALGRYNDQRVAAAEFAREAETQPQAWFGVGWLAARRRIAVKRCERALREAAKTRPFWHE